MADGWMLHNDGFWHQLHGIYCRIGEEWDFGGELQSFFLGLKMSLLVKKKNNKTPPKIGKVKLRSPLQPKGLSGKLDVDDQAEATTQPTGVQWATKMPRNGFLGKKKKMPF